METVLACPCISETIEFFVTELGFKKEYIEPADDPAEVVMSSPGGTKVRLFRSENKDTSWLRLLLPPDSPQSLVRSVEAPNGTHIELVDQFYRPRPTPQNEPSFVIQRLMQGGSSQWDAGRAGMLYRDLIPERQGGSFIASHIRIPDAGEVPDNVHFHLVKFQIIYCVKSWVKLVYEDQGPPFIMREGDCVLQPPRIRHRVLECGAGLEVVEVGSPASHPTHFDNEMDLPTTTRCHEREWEGQRFVFHEAAKATWTPWRFEGFEARDTGIGSASKGLGQVTCVRPTSASSCVSLVRDASDLHFVFVLDGRVGIETETAEGTSRLPALGRGDSFATSPDVGYSLHDCSDDLQFLEVTVTAAK